MKKRAAKKQKTERRKSLKRRAADHLPDFQDLVENSVQGILVHRNFKPLYANASFAKLFGYRSAKDILKLPLLRPLVPPDRWARVEEEYDELIRGRRKSVINRTRGIKKDGSEIWMAITHRTINWHGKKAVQTNAFDISDQMAIEHALLENEQHLRAMLEVLPYPIYITRHHDGQLLFVNRKTCLLFQKSAGQLLRGKSIDFFVDTQEREDLSNLLHKLGDIREIEVKMRDAHGKEFTAEIAAIMMDYGGQRAIMVALNDVSERKRLEAELFHEASTDSLTGLSNRRYFITQAEQEIRRARRFERNLSVMMLDLDHFKKVNDEHGHAAGDAVLQTFAKNALEGLRQSDFMGRLGGEEFALLMPETSLSGAKEVADRLRERIADRPIITGNETRRTALSVTVSIGVAELSEHDGSIDELLHRADEALYRAKRNGRNRVEVAA